MMLSAADVTNWKWSGCAPQSWTVSDKLFSVSIGGKLQNLTAVAHRRQHIWPEKIVHSFPQPVSVWLERTLLRSHLRLPFWLAVSPLFDALQVAPCCRMQ